MQQIFSPNSPIGRWLAFFLDALFICLAWTVCSLPIVTIGASTAALHRVAQNWMRERSDCDLKTYLRSFKENLKGGTAVWLILLVPLAIILLNAYIVWIASVETPEIAKWMIFVTAFLWMATAVYTFALQAIFENTPMRTVTNALRIAVSHLTTTLILVLLFCAAIFCTLLFPLGSFLYVPACVLLSARPVWGVFSKVMDSSQAEAEETDREEHKEENNE